MLPFLADNLAVEQQGHQKPGLLVLVLKAIAVYHEAGLVRCSETQPSAFSRIRGKTIQGGIAAIG